MENKEQNPLDSQTVIKIHFSSPEEERDCFINMRSRVIKLLYMIEEEQAGKDPAELWFYGFMLDLASANTLCNNKLTSVVIKIHSLYDNYNYKKMTHSQIKRQIMESKGILDHLINSEIKK